MMYVTFYLYSFLRSCEALVVGRRFLSGHAIRLRLIYTGTRYTWYAQFVLPCNRVTLHAYQVQYPNCLVIPRLTVYLSPRVLLHIPPPFDAFFILFFFFPNLRFSWSSWKGSSRVRTRGRGLSALSTRRRRSWRITRTPAG